MAQKSIPSINKSGYSMFWNSMWDSKNNFSKFLQKDFFIKSFINFFFLDFFQNQFIYFYDFKKINFIYINNKYNLNFVDFNKKYINIFFKNYFSEDVFLSKIWFFKYHNWVVVFFYIYSKTNSIFFKKNYKYVNDNLHLYNILNNYYLNLFKINLNSDYLNFKINLKDNF